MNQRNLELNYAGEYVKLYLKEKFEYSEITWLQNFILIIYEIHYGLTSIKFFKSSIKILLDVNIIIYPRHT